MNEKERLALFTILYNELQLNEDVIRINYDQTEEMNTYLAGLIGEAGAMIYLINLLMKGEQLSDDYYLHIDETFKRNFRNRRRLKQYYKNDLLGTLNIYDIKKGYAVEAVDAYRNWKARKKKTDPEE